MILRGRRVALVSGGTVPPDPISGTHTLIYGDSITAGASSSSPDKAYVAVYERLSGRTMYAMGSYSRTVQENLQSWNAKNSLWNIIFNPTSDQQQYMPVLPYDPKYKRLIFRLGINDCIQKPGTTSTVATFKSIYKDCLNHFINVKHWPTNRISLVNIGSYWGSNSETLQASLDYNVAIRELCTELGITHVDLRTFDNNNGGQTLYADDVHPNDLGHQKHAEFLFSVVP